MKKQTEEQKGFWESILDAWMELKLYKAVIGIVLLLIVILFVFINSLIQVLFP